MWTYVAPLLYAAFVWWFSTGVILLLVGRAPWTYRWSMGGATLVLIAALAGLVTSSRNDDPAGAYAAFTSAIVVWGWLEMAFLMGFLTGRRSTDAGPKGGLRHFLRAVAALLDHELSIIAGAALVVALTWEQPNQIGTWTFLALWGMRQSAKLNLFFGVRNLNDELLPPHLHHLKAFLRRRAMNPLLPVSVAAGTALCALVTAPALATDASGFEMVGFSLLGMMLALGVFEHCMLVLPLPVNALWRWSLRGQAGGADRTASRLLPAPAPARTSSRATHPWDVARRRLRLSPLIPWRTR